MKDNKTIKGIMIAAVILIWGIIIYRIVGMFFPDASPYAPIANVVRNEIKSKVPPSFSITANYRDPFFGKMFFPVEKPINKTVVKNAPPKETINWQDVRFFGMIRNNSTKKNVAMVNINGKDYMVLEGQTIDGFKFVKNTLDSVKITCKGKSCWVSKN